MKLVVRGLQGELHEFYINEPRTVGEVKGDLELLEGCPRAQMVIVHAGEELLDHIHLQDYELDDFNLSHEAFVHLARRAPSTTHIFFASPGTSQLVCEAVEDDTTLDVIMQLIVRRGLTTHMDRDGAVVIKRQSGTTIHTRGITKADMLNEVIAVIRDKGVQVNKLVFIPAPPGNLHILVGPLPELELPTYPIYSRSQKPQPLLPRKDQDGGIPLPGFTEEICL